MNHVSTGNSAERPLGNRRAVLMEGAVFLLTLLFYVLTLAPAVVWGDSASFAIQAKFLKLSVSADSHPLFIVLGHLFSYLPFEVAYCLNLLSAVTASLAVLMVYLIVLELTGSPAASLIGAASLSVSHAFWLHAVIAEVYDLNAFFVTAILLLLLKWSKSPKDRTLLYGAAFLFGLGLSNHLILGLTIFGFLFFALVKDRKILSSPRILFFILCSFAAGASLLIYLILYKVSAGRAAADVADAATGGHYRKAMFVLSPELFRELLKYFAYLFYQFPLLGFAMGFLGLFALVKNDRTTAVTLLLLIGVNMAFFLAFGPGVRRTTKYTFYISDYALFSILIGHGSYALGRYLQDKGYALKKVSAAVAVLVILLPVSLYTVTPHASRKWSIDLLHARSIPFRDNEDFFLFPGKRGYSGAEKYAEEVMRTARPDAVIIADFTPFSVLRYCQLMKGMRQDILLIFAGNYVQNVPQKTVSRYYGKREIYLASLEKYYYRIIELRESYDFVPDGILFKVVKKT